jgi:hypothetical protein
MTRNDQGTADKAGGAQVRQASVDDDIGIDDQRLLLRRGLAEAHVGHDEQIIPVAADREHHAEVGEAGINHETDDPRDILTRPQDIRGEKQLAKT